MLFSSVLTCIYREDDGKWPTKNKDGKQELEIRLGNDHISFEASRHGVKVWVAYTELTRRIDCQDWIDQRRDGIGRPRRPPSLLLSGARPQGSCFQSDCAAFQDQAHLNSKQGQCWGK